MLAFVEVLELLQPAGQVLAQVDPSDLKLQQDAAVGIHANDALRRMSERGVPGAADAAASHTGPRAPQPLPRP